MLYLPYYSPIDVVYDLAPKKQKWRKKKQKKHNKPGFAFLVIFYVGPYFLVPFGDYFLVFGGFWKANPSKGNVV